jgi:SAM-dependent methyltransferase
MNKLDLCSGTAAPRRKEEGYTTIDARAFDGVDYVSELGKAPLPFEDDTFDEIRAHDALEHIRDGFFELIDECWRVLKPKGIFDIHVPRFPAGTSVMHPDHVRFFLSEEDAIPFAAAVKRYIENQNEVLFCMHSFAFFHVPADGIDPHGYLKHFWHIVDLRDTETHIRAKLSPNKIGGRYPYKEIQPKL